MCYTPVDTSLIQEMPRHISKYEMVDHVKHGLNIETSLDMYIYDQASHLVHDMWNEEGHIYELYKHALSYKRYEEA